MNDIERTIAVLNGPAAIEERREACRVLAASDDPRVIAELTEVLYEDDPELVDLAAQSLAVSGDPNTWLSFEKVLRSDDAWGFRHKAVANASGTLADPRLIDALLDVLKTTTWVGVKEVVLIALGHIGGLRVVVPLADYAHDAVYSVRCAATEALGHLTHRDSVATLIQILGQEDRWGILHQTAARSLMAIQREASIPVLVQLLLKEKQFPSVLDGALEALTTIGDAAVPSLLSALPGMNSSTLEKVVHALSESGLSKLAGQIRSIFQGDESAATRLTADATGGDIRALSVLSDQLQKLNRTNLARDNFVRSVLRGAIESMYKAALPKLGVMYCKKDLTRFKNKEEAGLHILACRTCNETVHLTLVHQVIALLDNEMSQPVVDESDTYCVSWLHHPVAFDFDRVSIVRATDEEVMRLCMTVGNTSDPYHKHGFQSIPCEIAAGCVLNNNSLRVLARTFNVRS